MKLYPQYLTFVLTLLVGVNSGGCFISSDELLSTSANSWTKQDCMIVLISAIAHNLYDNRSSIKVIVTPYVPRVIQAITRMDQLGDTTSIDTAEFGKKYDALLRASTGLLYDWEKGLKFSSKHQRYYEHITDLDSLLFLVSISNIGWSSKIPEIDDLQSRILLLNDRQDTLRPAYVWGVRNNQLMTDETIFVMFQFAQGDKHFFDESSNMAIVFQSFTPSIGYKFNIAALME